MERAFSANIEGCRWWLKTWQVDQAGTGMEAFSDGTNLFQMREHPTKLVRRHFRVINGERVEVPEDLSFANASPPVRNEPTLTVTATRGPSFDLGLTSPLYHGFVAQFACYSGDDKTDPPPWEEDPGKHIMRTRLLTNTLPPRVEYLIEIQRRGTGEITTPLIFTNGVLDFLELTNVGAVSLPLSFQITRYRLAALLSGSGDYPILSRVTASVSKITKEGIRNLEIPMRTLGPSEALQQRLGAGRKPIPFDEWHNKVPGPTSGR